MTAAATRFHNITAAALADEIGRLDAIAKAAEADLKAAKDEFKRRGLTAAAGDRFAVTAAEQIAGRLDAKALRAAFGDMIAKFEVAAVSTVIRIRAADRLAAVAA